MFKIDRRNGYFIIIYKLYALRNAVRYYQQNVFIEILYASILPTSAGRCYNKLLHKSTLELPQKLLRGSSYIKAAEPVGLLLYLMRRSPYLFENTTERTCLLWLRSHRQSCLLIFAVSARTLTQYARQITCILTLWTVFLYPTYPLVFLFCSPCGNTRT